MRLRESLLLAVLLLANLGTAGAQPQKPNAEIPPNTTVRFSGSGILDLGTLTLDDGAVIQFDPTLDNVTITCEKLVLNGKAEIDLTRYVDPSKAPQPPGKPGTPQQAAPNGYTPAAGQNGTPGGAGSPGPNGINLVFRARDAEATNGSLWINTDGGRGYPGGPGGNGAKGSSGPNTCFKNSDGGNGGNGGTGGPGGPGGNTAAIWFSVAGKVVTPHATSGVSPTPRPPEANLNGIIVVAGNPGPGGPGGAGGAGGPAGEGHSKVGGFQCTDTASHSGAIGSPGATGSAGPPGQFITAEPPKLNQLK